jgi:hypothetical protein
MQNIAMMYVCPSEAKQRRGGRMRNPSTWATFAPGSGPALFTRRGYTDTLSIYVFDTDTLNTYDWVKVKVGYKVLKRYDLSLDDLKQMNWTITYP